MEEKRTLAKYDFRSKQEYIYRTDKVREIVGASELITRAYNDFFEALWNSGIRVDNALAKNGACPQNAPCAFEGGEMLRYINNPDCIFDPNFGDDLDGKIIYIGGGNLYMLWRTEEIARAASGVLSKMLREKAYSLSPVCGFAEYSGEYSEDMKKLNKAFESCKVTVPPFMPTAMLPFTELDRRTSLPVAYKSGKDKIGRLLKEDESISRESYLKRRQYKDTHGDKQELLDDLVYEKGVESLLAVIYIDGNNMGQTIQAKMAPNNNPITDYKEGVKIIRQLSNEIQESFVTKPREAIEKDAQNNSLMKDKLRWIVSGGDEITLICNAQAALRILGIYFKTLDKAGGGYTACAGVAVFHSHFPFSKAYAIAEECCEEAKKLNRKDAQNRKDAGGGQNCIVDFQYIYSGVTGDLKSMREAEAKLNLIARPYLISGTVSDIPLLKDNFLNRGLRLKKHIGRSNIKQLAALLFDPSARYDLELERLDAQFPEAELKQHREDDKKYMLDISQFYDIWFAEDKEHRPNIKKFYDGLF